MKDFLLSYVQNLEKRHVAKNTIDAYVRDISKFLNFVKDRKENLEEVEIVSIMAYVQFLQREGKATSSIVRNIVSIRNFFKYLIKKGVVNENPVVNYEIPKVKHNIPKVLTIEEVDKLLSSPQMDCNKGIRDKAMMETMYATGMKVSELLNLKIHNLNLKLSYIKCKDSRSQERIIPIGSIAVKYLEEYLKIRHEINKYNLDLIFLNLKGVQMTRQGFWKIIKYYSNESGIDKHINAFTLRHSFAVHLLQNGADIKSVQELLGHKDLSATQIYSVISKKSKIAEIYKKTHPRA